MSANDVKTLIRERVQAAGKMYLQDLEAMSEEQLSSSPGGTARSPYDFTYEVTLVNNRVASRLKGEDPGAWPGKGWLKAPDEFRTKEVAISGLSESLENIIKGWDAVPDGDLDRKIQLQEGETSPLDMMNLTASHLSYHDGQLNYHQAIGGDLEVHWKFDD